MSADLTMYILNERARFAYDNPKAAVAKTHDGFVVYQCAFRLHDIPFFSRGGSHGIPRQHFADAQSLENHFRSLVSKDLTLSELERATAKAREVYADASVIVRKENELFVIHHNEPTEPAYAFRSRPFERKVRDVIVARRQTKYPTPTNFSTLDELNQYLNDRAKKQARDAHMAETVLQGNAQLQKAGIGHGARVILCKRSTDTTNFLLMLDVELTGKREHPFNTMEELMQLIDAYSPPSSSLHRGNGRTLTDLQDKPAFSF